MKCEFIRIVRENLGTKLLLAFIAITSSAMGFAATFTGTGFLISTNGYLVTNFHVVEAANELTVIDNKGQSFPAKLIRVDSSNDLAILKIEGTFPAIPLARSSNVRRGDPVFTLGYPNTRLQGLAVKFTDGTVSSLTGIQDSPNSFQISVPIQPGNSGGPLISRDGAVVGVVVAKLSASAALKAGSQIPEAVNYAVKSNYLMELIETDLNLAGRINLLEKRKKEIPLPELVAQTEPSVVLIYATSVDKQSPAVAAKVDVDKPKIDVRGAWIRSTVAGQKLTGIFMKITSNVNSRLVGASSPIAGALDVNEMRKEGDAMKMRPLTGGLELPSGSIVELKPGGFHILVRDLKATLSDGENVPLTLVIKDQSGRESLHQISVPVSKVAP